MTVFPADALDDQNTPAKLLGTWFGRDSERFDQSVAVVAGILSLFRDVDVLRDEVVAAASRDTIPLLSIVGRLPIRLLESAANQQAAIPRYGETDLFGSGLAYGSPVVSGSWYFPVSREFARIGLLVDRIESPTVSLFPGLDFSLEADRILFQVNPFEDSRFSVEPVYRDGEQVDRQLVLWTIAAAVDAKHLQNRFGFATSCNWASTESYRRFVSAVWDAWTVGPSLDVLQRIVSAIADIPFADGDETVLELASDSRGQVIVTERAAYRVPASAAVLVAVGDALDSGQRLVDTIQLSRVSGRSSVADLSGLSLDAGWLPAGFFDSIVFENRDAPVTTSVVDGRLVVQFPLGGWPGDVDRFWELMHARGLAGGATLAQLLDPRENPVGEPFAASMPTTINPLQFLADNVIRNKAVVIRLRPGEFGEQALPLAFLQILRAVMPPWHGLFVILELALPGDAITMGAAGSDDSPGYSEPGLVGMETGELSESLEYALITESPRFRDIDGVCV